MNCYWVYLELELGVLWGSCNWSCEYDEGRRREREMILINVTKFENLSLLIPISIFPAWSKLKDNKVSEQFCV